MTDERTDDAPEVEALQTTLAAEHAAVYAFGVLGGRTSRAATPQLFATVSAAYAAHRARRDHLVRELAGQDVDLVAAEPAYDVPGPWTPRRRSSGPVWTGSGPARRRTPTWWPARRARRAGGRSRPNETRSANSPSGNSRDIPRRRRVRGPLRPTGR